MTPAPPPDLDLLTSSWALTLRAQRKSPKTISTYLDGIRAFLRWCAREGVQPELSRRNVELFLAATFDDGLEATTAMARHVACRRYSAWLAAEGEIAADPLLGLKGPKLDQKVVMPLTDDEVKALIEACRGNGFVERRDEALIRLMNECGSRGSETASMLLSETNVVQGTTVIRRGKGGKGRLVPFGPQTARALDRYIRLRRGHRLAESDALWLGGRGQGFGYDGLYAALMRRAEAAGVREFHPHRLRHTFADRWLAAGGTEAGLMAVAGWDRPEMLLRYTRGRASARAMDEARRLNLGDV